LQADPVRQRIWYAQQRKEKWKLVKKSLTLEIRINFGRPPHYPPSDFINDCLYHPLYSAVRALDVNQVRLALRSGKMPKTFGQWSILQSLLHLPPFAESKIKLERKITIFSLLLDYGAPIDKGFYNGKTALSSLISEAQYHELEDNFQPLTYVNEHFNYFKNLIMMLILIDDNRSFSYINKRLEESSPLAKLIVEGQQFAERSRAPKASLTPNFSTTITYSFGSKLVYRPRCFTYTLNQNIKLKIETSYLNEAINDKSLINQLYELFKKQWKNFLDEKKARNYFNKILDINGNVYIDVVKLNDVVVGYNIAEFRNVQCNQRDVLLHHVRLALIDSNYSQCKGIMLFISHSKGFLGLEHDQKMKVITVFEAASPASMLAIEFLDDYYPKTLKLEKYCKLLFMTIYKNDAIIYDINNKVYRIKDELAQFTPAKDESPWKTRTKLAANRFFSYPLYHDGESIIVMYKNNRTNFTFFQSQLTRFLKTPTQAALSSSIPTAKI
jgi:hypothetical protein